jgi:dihydrofolate reductase
MRKVILQELVTVDGYAAGPNGELDFFEAISDYSEVDQDNIEALENVDAILLGAASYRMFVEYWPTADDEIVAKAVNTIPKLVFSSTLERAPWGDWPEAQVVRGEATDEVAALKRAPGKDIIVWGSLSLAQSLLAADLIDEVQLRVCPIPLGAGRRIFTEDTKNVALHLLEAKPYTSGIVSLRYATQRP